MAHFAKAFWIFLLCPIERCYEWRVFGRGDVEVVNISEWFQVHHRNHECLIGQRHKASKGGDNRKLPLIARISNFNLLRIDLGNLDKM